MTGARRKSIDLHLGRIVWNRRQRIVLTGRNSSTQPSIRVRH
jgi:hypothetical protein